MENCQVLNLIKKMDPELQRAFKLDDLKESEDCKLDELESQLNTYIKLGILALNKDGSYMVKNMCMLSQF